MKIDIHYRNKKVCRDAIRTNTTSEMELFAKLVNNFQPLNIVTKSPIPDIAAVLNMATMYCIQKSRL